MPRGLQLLAQSYFSSRADREELHRTSSRLFRHDVESNAASQATRHLSRLTPNFQGRGFPSGQDDIHDYLSEDIAISRYSSTSDKIARRLPVSILCKVSCWREQVVSCGGDTTLFLLHDGGEDGRHTGERKPRHSTSKLQ